jgi:siroheme synthase (precorrin-2 oxidase/ferrochelatase)
MDVFLAGAPLAGARIAIVGEGEAADAKARLFEGSPAEIVRLAPQVAERVESYAGARLAFIALPGAAAAAAAAAARQAGAWVNVVDRPELCDFTTPAFVDRGAVVGAIATGGAAPLLASELRREWEARWPLGLGRLAELIAAVQGELRVALPDLAARRAWLRRLLDGEAAAAALRGEAAAAVALARRGLSDRSRQGRLSLLVPPSSPDLITLRALQVLGRADRLVTAGPIDPTLLAMARRDAPVYPVGDTTPEEIRAEVGEGASVVLVGAVSAFAGYGVLERLPTAAPRDVDDAGEVEQPR